MGDFIDLSHDFEDGMLGFKFKGPNGAYIQYTAHIKPFLTHEQTKQQFEGRCSFETTEISFQSPICTYLDSPYHRYKGARDISAIKIEEVVLPGVLVDARGRGEFEAVGSDAVPKELDLNGKAILFNFGWDTHWGTEQYQSYPFISKELIELLITRGAKLVGVDTVNIDSSRDLDRPAHSHFLKNDVLIVENLANLVQLYGKTFRFFAVPIKGKKVATMPVRAFAETQ